LIIHSCGSCSDLFLCALKKGVKKLSVAEQDIALRKNVDSQEKRREIFTHTEENKLTFSRLKKRGLFCGKEQRRQLL
jgi:hypothetical protein